MVSSEVGVFWFFDFVKMGVTQSKKVTNFEGKELPPEGTATYEIRARIGSGRSLTSIDGVNVLSQKRFRIFHSVVP